MVIRLIASDLDGTLFGSDHVPEARTVAAVNAAIDAGLLFVAVTGRSHFGGVTRATSTGARLHWFIGSNGSHRLNLTTGAVEERLVFEADLLHATLATLRAAVGDVGFGHEHESSFSFDARFLELHPRSSGDDGFRAPPPPELRDVCKFFVGHADVLGADLVALLEPHLPEGMYATTSGAPFVEVTPAGGDKGSALARLCDEIGISAQEVIAFGDNHNDLTMIEWAGRGVAMGNAVDKVKAIADEVTAANVDFGVAMVIEALLGPDAY